MRWTRGDRSNVEDARGGSGMGRRVGLPLGLGGIVVLAILSWATGTDFLSLLAPQGGQGPTEVSVPHTPPASTSAEEEKLVDFVDAVMRDVQDTWSQLLGGRYRQTKAVLFRDAIQSACGFAESATGPFYCPGDQQVYLDLGFFGELRRLGAPGDFAEAYVLAHELGHHIQMLTGIEEKVRRAQQADPSQRNALSVRMELQADCLAGVWGHFAAAPGRAAAGKVELEAGDLEEGLTAAAAIGDDRLQKMSRGRVVPDSFTHGSSAQRVESFRRGFDSGRVDACGG